MNLRVIRMLVAWLPLLTACATMPAEYGATRAAQSTLPAAPLPPPLPPEALAPAAATGATAPTILLAQAPAAAAETPPFINRTWQWLRSEFRDDKRVTAAAPERYTLQFGPDGRVRVRADCNRGNASYSPGPEAHSLTLSAVTTTRMGCPPDSQDSEFLRQLAMVSGWMMADGDLVLWFKFDSGSMRLRAGK